MCVRVPDVTLGIRHQERYPGVYRRLLVNKLRGELASKVGGGWRCVEGVVVVCVCGGGIEG